MDIGDVVRESGCSCATLTWSVVAKVQSGLRTPRPAFFKPSNACCKTKTSQSFKSVVGVRPELLPGEAVSD